MEHANANDAVVTASVAAATTSLYGRAGINLHETLRRATGQQLIYVHVYICICVNVYIYIYIYIFNPLAGPLAGPLMVPLAVWLAVPLAVGPDSLATRERDSL